MIDHATFNRHVRDVLAHLYDPPYLRNHPLARLLGDTSPRAPGESRLGQLLLDAIEQLRPPAHVQPEATSWRRYHVLALRYREGMSPEQVARELKLSERQARRDHQDGVEAVAALLWGRLAHPAEADAPPRAAAADQPASLPDPGDEGLATELLKLGRQRGSEPADLWATLQGTLSVVSSLATSQNISLQVAPAETPFPVTITRPALRQLLLTLLSYAFEREPDSRMAVEIADAPGSATLRIRISPAHASATGSVDRQSLLAEAQQLWTVARNLAELHGASLETGSSEDQTSITLAMPAAEVVTVLVVDDSPDFLRLFRRYLVGTRYSLCSARTPAGALRLAAEARPDVIILDVLMPTQDGWEVLSALKARPDTRRIPVIVCSVLPERTLALSLGVTDFLPKPVTQEGLLAALERASPSPTAPLSRSASPPQP